MHVYMYIAEAIDHFAGLGYTMPAKTNPSDFFMDIMTLDQRSDELRAKSLARIEKFVSSYEAIRKERYKDSASESGSMQGNGKSDKVQWPSSWGGEFTTLLGRNMVDISRNKALLAATIGQAIFLMIVIGFIFFKVSNDAGGVQSRIGFLFFICINQTFGVVSICIVVVVVVVVVVGVCNMNKRLTT
eukprot:jgi/Hompol1/1957/HPOL_000593-RA